MPSFYTIGQVRGAGSDRAPGFGRGRRLVRHRERGLVEHARHMGVLRRVGREVDHQRGHEADALWAAFREVLRTALDRPAAARTPAPG
uniref:hypothetical protein n=1 Tax=Streptomyces sp. SAT1 TaxID=1849967 RepID=UPI00144A868F|nr:hypothetical protein [Streptomyces sp. SAT1]